MAAISSMRKGKQATWTKEDAFKSDTAVGWQTDRSYQLGNARTVRAGLYYQRALRRPVVAILTY